MTNPKTGWITREWEIETITSPAFAAGVKTVMSSKKHPVVGEAIFLGGVAYGGGTTAAFYGGTVVGHNRAFPDEGTVSATQAATLGPQQFIHAGWSGGQATQIVGQYAIRGR